jgi:uncharacterized protein
MTIAAAYWPRRHRLVDRAAQALRIRIDPQVEVVALVDEPPEAAKGTLILVHGLTGSAASSYMRGVADKALARGFRTLRLNLRGCGDTEHLAPTLYHSGLSGDLAAVVAEVERRYVGPIALGGFSLGGNIVLKLAGEWGSAAPPRVVAVAAISAPIDLAACAARIGSGGVNRVYEQRFVARLVAQLRRRAEVWPGRFEVVFSQKIRTIREFDEAVTAPHFGFAGADDYYARCSARPLLDAIRLPTFAVVAQDDPMIEATAYPRSDSVHSPLQFEIPAHGGHLGFIAAEAGDGAGNRFWAERRLVDFLSTAAFGPGGK